MRFGRKIYQSHRQDIKILYVIRYLTSIWGKTLDKKRDFAGGHKTKTPAAMTYLSVVSRYSVWIELIIAALNHLDMLDFNIQNAYLTAYCRELVWVVARPEFGYKAENNILVINSLYGLKIYVTAFREFLADTLDAMGYRPIYDNPDL